VVEPGRTGQQPPFGLGGSMSPQERDGHGRQRHGSQEPRESG
jgi:hypothetical protein